MIIMVATDRFEKALVFATQLNAGGNGSATPDISHLLSVSGIAVAYGADEDEAIAALLRGSINGAGEKGVAKVKDDIRKTFGDKVVEIVSGLIDADAHPSPALPEHRDACLARLRNSSSSVRLILAAERLQSAKSLLKDYRELGEELWKGVEGGREGALRYYSLLIAELRKETGSPIAEELDRVIAEIGKLAAARKCADRLAAMDMPVLFQ
jgi:GTP pyrophosphokinase